MTHSTLPLLLTPLWSPDPSWCSTMDSLKRIEFLISKASVEWLLLWRNSPCGRIKVLNSEVDHLAWEMLKVWCFPFNWQQMTHPGMYTWEFLPAQMSTCAVHKNPTLLFPCRLARRETSVCVVCACVLTSCVVRACLYVYLCALRSCWIP